MAKTDKKKTAKKKNIVSLFEYVKEQDKINHLLLDQQSKLSGEIGDIQFKLISDRCSLSDALAFSCIGGIAGTILTFIVLYFWP